MNWQDQLISIYLTACDFFSQLPPDVFLKIGPHSCPRFSDAEAMTIYIFGIIQNLRDKKSIHRFFKDHLSDWFPDLPEYEGFLSRINNLNRLFVEFCAFLLKDEKFQIEKDKENFLMVVDSLPIVMAKNYRAHKCVTAKDFASVGYCSSKNMYYHGVKLHLLAEYQSGALPIPRILKMTKASTHDFTAMKEHFFEAKGAKILGDKAYCSKKTKKDLLEQGIELHTPIKRKKNKKTLDENEKIYSKIISSFRQSIEIHFNWLIETSGIQMASKVRSTRGLFVHVFGRFSACLFKYKFSL